MVVADVNALNRAAVDEIKTAAEAAIRERGRFTIALSGGNTPRAVYSLLAENKDSFPWAKTFFFFGDERSVPPDHPDSNYRMVTKFCSPGPRRLQPTYSVCLPSWARRKQPNSTKLWSGNSLNFSPGNCSQDNFRALI